MESGEKRKSEEDWCYLETLPFSISLRSTSRKRFQVSFCMYTKYSLDRGSLDSLLARIPYFKKEDEKQLDESVMRITEILRCITICSTCFIGCSSNLIGETDIEKLLESISESTMKSISILNNEDDIENRYRCEHRWSVVLVMMAIISFILYMIVNILYLHWPPALKCEAFKRNGYYRNSRSLYMCV